MSAFARIERFKIASRSCGVKVVYSVPVANLHRAAYQQLYKALEKQVWVLGKAVHDTKLKLELTKILRE